MDIGDSKIYKVKFSFGHKVASSKIDWNNIKTNFELFENS